MPPPLLEALKAILPSRACEIAPSPAGRACCWKGPWPPHLLEKLLVSLFESEVHVSQIIPALMSLHAKHAHSTPVAMKLSKLKPAIH
jgi:hypothetical protein